MSANDYSATALRAGTWHFLTGKAISAPLTLIALLGAVRLLPVTEYATYVTMLATVEICMVVGTFGLPWMASRYIPAFNVKAGRQRLRRLCLQLLAVQTLALLAVAAILVGVALAFNLLPDLQGLIAPVLAMATMVLIEGVGRFVRDSQLAPLMMQRATRLSLVLRQLLLVLSLAGMAILDLRSAQVLFLAECVASAIATVVALVALLYRLGSAGDTHGGVKDRISTESRAQYGVALHMYGAHLFSLGYSPLVLLLVLQRVAGAEAAALFGFLRLVHDQIARYLPATLLFSLIRPKLMTGFVQSGFGELNRNAVLSGKLSLFVLYPIVAFVAVTGDPLVGMLSSNRFEGAGLVLLGFVIALVPFSQRQLLESVAVAANLSRLCLVASAASAVALPLLFLLWPPPFGTTAALACMILGHSIFNIVLAVALNISAGYRGDLTGGGKLMAATAFAGAAGWIFSLAAVGWTWGVIAAGVVSLVGFFVAAWVIKPFSAEERGRINGLARRRIFFW